MKLRNGCVRFRENINVLKFIERDVQKRKRNSLLRYKENQYKVRRGRRFYSILFTLQKSECSPGRNDFNSEASGLVDLHSIEILNLAFKLLSAQKIFIILLLTF